MASRDLPDAVGPTMTTRRGRIGCDRSAAAAGKSPPAPAAAARAISQPSGGRHLAISPRVRPAWPVLLLLLTSVLTRPGVAGAEPGEERVDVLVIGASPSGLTAAQAARESGARRIAVVGAHHEPSGHPDDRHNPVILRKRIVQILNHFGVPVGDPRYVKPFA